MWETTQIKKIIIHVPKMPKKKYVAKTQMKKQLYYKNTGQRKYEERTL